MQLDHPYDELQQMRQCLLLGIKSHKEIVLELLTKWRDRNKSNATPYCLSECFRALGMNDIANRLVKVFVPDLKNEHVDISTTCQQQKEPAENITKKIGSR